MQRRNIRTISRPPLKIKHVRRLVKDLLGLNVPGIYKIPCSCGLSYILGQTGKTVAIRENEHQCHLRIGNMDKLALAQHGWDTRHTICLAETAVLYVSSIYRERVIRESMEIHLTDDILNKEDDMRLSTAYQLMKQVFPAEET